jgi:hypothetical protein
MVGDGVGFVDIGDLAADRERKGTFAPAETE